MEKETREWKKGGRTGTENIYYSEMTTNCDYVISLSILRKIFNHADWGFFVSLRFRVYFVLN